MTRKLTATELFFALVRCSIGTADILPIAPTREQWEELFETARKQALQGVLFEAIEKLPQEQRPPAEVLLPWYNTSETIKRKNADLTKKAIILSEKFKKEGFRNCILKGQGVALYYPNPHSRLSGDVDMWLDGGCDRIIEFVKGLLPESKSVYHHIDFPMYDEVDIELHYRPTWLCNPIHNGRLQRFFKETAELQFSNCVQTANGAMHVPTTAFNLIYIQLHIFRHLFDEGVGLRQIMDYYFILKRGIDDKEKEECIRTLESIGQIRFTKALMYVIAEIFGIDEKMMIVKPDSRYGRFLLNEIMHAGNFGKYETRYRVTARGFSLARLGMWIRRSARLLAYSPEEILWDPYFKIRNLCWRLHRN
jgi:hypothetical protein